MFIHSLASAVFLKRNSNLLTAIHPPYQKFHFISEFILEINILKDTGRLQFKQQSCGMLFVQ
jgi:hypothetical protein